MKKLLCLAVFSLLLAALLSPVAGRSALAAEQISLLPARMTANSWAWPACDGAKRLQIYTKRFVFEGTRNRNLLYRPVKIMREGPVYRLQSGVSNPAGGSLTYTPLFDVRLVQDGRLMRYDLPLFVKADGTDPFYSGYANSYYPCTEISSPYTVFDPGGLDAIGSLDHIDSVCGTVPISKSPACQKAVFSGFDDDKSDTLSLNELSLAFRQVVFTSASLGCDMDMYFPANTESEGTAFAETVMKTADQDGDGVLSLEETQAGWETIAKTEQFISLMPHLDNLSALLPFLPAGAPLPGCTCTASS